MNECDPLAPAQKCNITDNTRVKGGCYTPSFLMLLTLCMPLHPEGKTKQSPEKKKEKKRNVDYNKPHKHDAARTHTHTQSGLTAKWHTVNTQF